MTMAAYRWSWVLLTVTLAPWAGATPLHLLAARRGTELVPPGDFTSVLSVAESRAALRASVTSKVAYAARRAEYRYACACTGGVAALLAYLTDVCLSSGSPIELRRTGLSMLTGIDRPRLQLLLVALITLGELWALYRLTLLYAVKVSAALGLPDRKEVRDAIRELVRSTALGAPPLSLAPSKSAARSASRLGLSLVASGSRSKSAARASVQLAISLGTQVEQVVSRGYKQVFSSWSGPGSSRLLTRLASRFISRELSRVALPLAAIPFWVLWNIGKANAVMCECTALTIGPALAVEAADGLLPRFPLLELPSSHRLAVVRAVAASVHHNVDRIQLPLPGFGYSAAAGAVHPNAAALLGHLEARCGLVPRLVKAADADAAAEAADARAAAGRARGRTGAEPSGATEGPAQAARRARRSAAAREDALDSVSAFQTRVLPALDARGRVLALRMLALALCLDGHVNLPDRFFFVRCSRAAGMPVDREVMSQFRALEKLFGDGALCTKSLTQLFATRVRAEGRPAEGIRLRGRSALASSPSAWWWDLRMTLCA
jgi:hypothetical protein